MKFLERILIALLICPIFFTSSIRAQETVCNASNAQEMSACVTNLNSEAVSEIKVAARITCSPTQPCGFTITAPNGGKIYGDPSKNAGFYRTGSYNSQIFKIDGQTSNLTITDLTFEDNASEKCIDSCVAQINTGGSNITFERVKMNHSKQQAITSAGRNLKILNSSFFNSYSQTIWLGITDTALIEGNIIRYGGGSGVFVRGKNITIRNNTFERNQWNTPWIVQGGQVYLNGGWDDGVNPVPESSALDDLTFTANRIINGYYYLHFTAGIEMSGMIRNANINGNYINNNTASGIVTHTSKYFSNVVIEDNEITKNKSPIDDLEGRNNWIVRNNCYVAPCNTLPRLMDINGNGSVDSPDLNVLKTNFGQSGSEIQGDFDSNGKVDIFDYNAFIAEYKKVLDTSAPTPTPNKIVISQAGINTSGAYATNWAVWASVQNLGAGNVYGLIRVKSNGHWWAPLVPVIYNSDRTGISFIFPKVFRAEDECNLNGPCEVTLTLINYDTLADSNEYTITLPKK